LLLQHLEESGLVFLSVLSLLAQPAYEKNLPLEHEAIAYRSGASDDPVARLARELESGEAALTFEERGRSYLPSLLERLGLSADSQVLVFSKTSLQEKHIGPRSPRAIYFSDAVAVAYVPGAEVIELAAVDPRKGVVFYTLGAARAERPRFHRPEGCLECHQGPATLGVPGMYVGSVATTSTGRADFRPGTVVTDHRTPFEERWSGWYVTGRAGGAGHRGNTVALDPMGSIASGGEDLLSLETKFEVSPYLAPSSDIVALMTLEHQTQAGNLITRLGWEARLAEGEDHGARVDELVRYLLFADEVPLPGPIRGMSTFAETFSRRGPRDSKGRSLRDFDLETRLFRYPLSYTIGSEAFDALPAAVRDEVYRRLHRALAARDDGRAVLEIVRETNPNAPPDWRE
jgi:hypothetical protein